jgi:hypothetical protein
MEEPTFDIVSGTPDEDEEWVEAVAGLSNARERMGEIAERNPGRYFLFSIGSQSILAQVQTFKKRASSPASLSWRRTDWPGSESI